MQIKNTRINPEIISYRIIRRSIGVLGILLPFALLFFAWLLGCDQMQPSISHYYYTKAGSLFVGMLCAVGLFLVSYKGYGPADNIATNLAGVFAFCIAFFPANEFGRSTCALFDYTDNNIRNTIHYVSAGLFFLTLAFISYFLFTNTPKNAKNKPVRDKVFKTCAVLMVIFVILVPVSTQVQPIDDAIEQYNPVFWLECFALISFGISWLVKGN